MSLSDAEIGKVHNQVKSPWFLQLNPNGRIPTITDKGFPVFETSAILDYLAGEYDKDHKFSWDRNTNPKEFSEQLQWLFFTVSAASLILLLLRQVLSSTLVSNT